MDMMDTVIENEDGSVDVTPAPEEALPPEEPYDHYENLALKLSDDILQKISADVLDGFSADKASREPWERMVVKGLDLLGLELKENTEPFEGACGATHPLILESAVKFQAKAAKELFPPSGPVKAQIIGAKTPEKMLKANRVSEHMNYQINELMEEYFPDMENLLLYVPIVGIAFKKVYYDNYYQAPCSEFVPADQLVVPANAVNLKKCQRYTHILYKNKNDMIRDQTFGVYRNDIELPEPSKPEVSEISKKFNDIIGIVSNVSENDSVYTLLEQHTYLTLEGTPYEDSNGLALPYVVTVDKGTSKVLSIRRNWKFDDPNRDKRVWFVKYPFVPGFGFYSLGFIHLLGNFELTLTMTMRSLVDAGQFATLQGGFKAKGVKIQNNDPLRPGEWKEMEAAGIDITKALLPVPYKEPSRVLFEMLQYLEARGQKFADSTEQVISDSTNYGPVGTTLALLEASTKFFSGIHKRLHYAQKQEFRIIADLNGEYLPAEGYPYDVVGGERTIYAMDYDPRDVTVIPHSDPNISSNAHKMALAQTKLQVAQQFPGMVNTKQIIREFFEAIADGSDPNALVPMDQKPQPQDPVSDIMSAAKGAPIAAFPGQDHDSHIKVKGLWLNDPNGGKNPIMQGVAPMIAANMKEHMVLRYQEMMNAAIKQQNPQGLDPQVGMEAAIAQAAPLVAKANALKSELDGTQDPLLIAALAEKQSADNEKIKIEYEHRHEVAHIALKNKELSIKAKELGMSQEQHRKEMGKDMVESGLDRLAKLKTEELKAQTQEKIAKSRPKPSGSGKPKK
jgi:hypothetical protein